METQTNYDYLALLWQDLTPKRKRRWLIFLLIVLVWWSIGAVLAYSDVAGIVRLKPPTRQLSAIAMGPFGLLWRGLKWWGVIQESTSSPNLLWIPLAGAPLGLFYLAIQFLSNEPHPLILQRRRQTQNDRAQGRLETPQLIEKLACEQGVLAATVFAGKRRTVTVGLDYARSEGHMLVTGPTRSGKGLHLTETLLNWPGAALVLDPKGEQYRRTAGYRQQQFGSPIYRLPGQQLHLAYYYDALLDRDSVSELHHHLLRPWQSRERIFADKARSLFIAAGLYAQAQRLNPLRVLLDAAEADPSTALTAFETVPSARRLVRVFTDGLAPKDFHDNRFATSSFGTFTTMLSGYQKHIDTITPARNGPTVIPRDWAARGATIYLTYSLTELHGVGGVVAAVIAALLRYQMNQANHDRLLVAIDELPAVGLQNIASYLATAGGYGITLLLYAQAISQLHGLYGQTGTNAILANCAHQVWYPPTDMQTAKLMSDLYGMTSKSSPSHSLAVRQQWVGGQRQETRDDRYSQGWSERPVLSPSEMLSLPKEQVLVLMQKERQYRFLGQRLNPIPRLSSLPSAPLLPRLQPQARTYTDWQNLVTPTSNAPATASTANAADNPQEARQKTNDVVANEQTLHTGQQVEEDDNDALTNASHF